MKTLFGILVWIMLTICLIPVYLLGFITVPLGLVADGQYKTPWLWTFWGKSEDIPSWWYARVGESRWSKFLWMQIRNPMQGLKSLAEQPCDALHPNPDELVRTPGGPVSASLWTSHGIFWEYWYMREIKGEFFEFRIGWRFGDTKANFSPTWQLRYGE